jgi:hypothetical protein
MSKYTRISAFVSQGSVRPGSRADISLQSRAARRLVIPRGSGIPGGRVVPCFKPGELLEVAPLATAGSATRPASRFVMNLLLSGKELP